MPVSSMCNGFCFHGSASTRLNPNPRPGNVQQLRLPKVAKASSNAHRAAGDFPIGWVPVLLNLQGKDAARRISRMRCQSGDIRGEKCVRRKRGVGVAKGTLGWWSSYS
ncbi:hypothetical protein I7I51_01568 [Histoplasma capsulatum]|uniref:Uncharacterized protein n=1 Tax=Ajellomyces capsulatus TaxID=5037 RepID=A0A8A1MH92_AJECA|nr:hypothetical protein I7I51_01568 [Histoplasma capsulatum]